jgi:prepilin-type N-terminal cleavage/methylation domain-containing protein
MIFYKKNLHGFTLIELLVTVSIIAILSSVIYVSFEESRQQSRDKVRQADLLSLQLAVELYKGQYGRYPAAGCSAVPTEFAGPGPESSTELITCTDYIVGDQVGRTFVPDIIAKLPTDPNSEDVSEKGFYYRTDADGISYKIIILGSVEVDSVVLGDEFARCPIVTGCGGAGSIPTDTYAVYSLGAEDW